MNKDWIAYIPYYGDNKINDFNLKESKHIKLWNIKENKDINYLHYHYSELIVAYSIWKHQIKNDYICLWDHRRFLTPINFYKLDNDMIQVYYHGYTDLTPFEYMLKEGINEYIILQFIKYMIEEKYIDHDLIINIIFNEKWKDKLWFHSCFNCNWHVFNDLCEFIFGFLSYIIPTHQYKDKHSCDLFIQDMQRSISILKSKCKDGEIIDFGRIESGDRDFANLFEMLLPLYCELVGYETFAEFDNKKIGVEINEFNEDTIKDQLKGLVSKNCFTGCRQFYVKTSNDKLKQLINDDWYYIYHAPLIFIDEFEENTIILKLNEYIDAENPNMPINIENIKNI